MSNRIAAVLSALGADTMPASHTERLISTAGGGVAILLVGLISNSILGQTGAAFMIASMGSSAVLLFAVPHGLLSQPWAVLVGHVTAAVVGVACYQLVPDIGLAAALAAGLSIGVMYYLHAVHPPAGATALTAVLGDANLHALGYKFVLMPVLLNVVVILTAAVAFNYLFKWRRYPRSLMPRAAAAHPEAVGETPLTHGDIEYALRKMGSYVDVTEEELTQIFALALEHAHEAHLVPQQIRLGETYSNGSYGDNWSVRQVIDQMGVPDPDEDMLIYRVVAGKDRRKSGVCSRAEFARWAKYDVERNENSWQLRMHPPVPKRTAPAGDGEAGVSPPLPVASGQ